MNCSDPILGQLVECWVRPESAAEKFRQGHPFSFVGPEL